MDKNEFIELLSEQLKKGNVGFMVGAGVSFNSGIPTVVMILKKIMTVLEASQLEKDTLLLSNLPFESYMEVMIDNSDPRTLYQLFQDKLPNRNHYLMAVSGEQFNNSIVLTTNFDTLIEQAFTSQDRFEKSNVYNENQSKGKVKIYKIHGCISDTEALEITLRAVANSTGLPKKQKLIEELLINGDHDYVFVWGYSCSDVFDITPLIEKISTAKKILFIQHEFDPEVFKCESIGNIRDKNPFVNFSGYRIYINTDELVDALEKNIGVSMPKNEIVDKDWEQIIENWSSQPTLTQGQKLTILGSLMKKIGNYPLSISCLERSLACFKNEENLLNYNVCLQNLGQSYLYDNQLEKARECLESCLEFFNKPIYAPALSSTLNDLGGIYKSLKNYEMAKHFFEQSLTIADKYQLNNHLGNRYGNIASVFFETGELGKSRECAIVALKNARHYGDKRLESNMLALMAMINQLLGQRQTISEIDKAAEISKDIGDTQLNWNQIVQKAEHLGRDGRYLEAIGLLNNIELEKLSIDKQVLVITKIIHQYGNLNNKEAMKKIMDKFENLFGSLDLEYDSKALILGNKAQLSFLEKDFNSAVRFNIAKLDLSRKAQNKEVELISLKNLIECYLALRKYNDMKSTLIEAEELAVKTNNIYLLKSIYNRLGDYFNRILDDATALHYFEKALEIYHKTKDPDIDKILNSIAKTKFNMFKYAEAKEIWKFALTYAIEYKHFKLIEEIKNNLKSVY